MKETKNINLAGHAFVIDKDAAERIEQYLKLNETAEESLATILREHLEFGQIEVVDMKMADEAIMQAESHKNEESGKADKSEESGTTDSDIVEAEVIDDGSGTNDNESSDKIPHVNQKTPHVRVVTYHGSTGNGIAIGCLISIVLLMLLPLIIILLAAWAMSSTFGILSAM